MNCALIIVAHPDDAVLSGATISKYSRIGTEFMVLLLRMAHLAVSISKFNGITAIADRKRMAICALTRLGVNKYHFNNLPCGRLDQVPIITINKMIEGAIHEFEPDTVLTHSVLDANNDHRIVSRATMMATRPVTQNRVDRLLSYEVLSSSEWSFGEAFAPNIFVQIDEHDLSQKWKALAAYESELKSFPFPRSEEGLRAMAMCRGMQAGVPLAEAFCLLRDLRA